MSYTIPKKEQLLEKFIKTIESITPKILEMDNPLITSRLILLLGYYIDILYSKNDELFLKVLELLVLSLN
jgi:hypothetical protein